jgi:hypothetical protein
MLWHTRSTPAKKDTGNSLMARHGGAGGCNSRLQCHRLSDQQGGDNWIGTHRHRAAQARRHLQSASGCLQRTQLDCLAHPGLEYTGAAPPPPPDCQTDTSGAAGRTHRAQKAGRQHSTAQFFMAPLVTLLMLGSVQQGSGPKHILICSSVCKVHPLQVANASKKTGW